MAPYHKIQTLFKRDMSQPNKPIMEGEWSVPELGYLADNQWEFTEKVDGTNIRVYYNPEFNTLAFNGRTNNASIPSQLLNRLTDKFMSLREKGVLSDVFTGPVVMYGEGYGAKIQKGGGNYRADQDFVLFDVKIGDWWLRRGDVEEVGKTLELDVVPIVGRGTLYDAIDQVKKGVKSKWGDFEAEGIVARPTVELFARNGERIITKIKCRDFPKPMQ